MPVVTAAQRHRADRDPVRDVHVILLEFREDGQSVIERAAINTDDVIWQEQLYTRAQIDVKLPSSGGDDTSAQLIASNISRILGRAIDGARQRINCRMIVLDLGNPLVPLQDTSTLMIIGSASGNSEKITATLAPRASLLEPVQHSETTRLGFPGLWLN